MSGAWRFLEHEYHFRVLSYILNFVDENSWPIDRIYKTETLQSLAALVPMDILDQCFSWYTEETGTMDKDGQYRFEKAQKGPLNWCLMALSHIVF
jgi:sister chromatid cohesion protein DCC1